MKQVSSAMQKPFRHQKTRVVIALGGNALQKDGEVTAEAQKKVAAEIGKTIAHLSTSYEIIVAHGNGPQVGNILVHEENAATNKAPAMPLETAVAMSQGQIGYWLAQAIDNAFIMQQENQGLVDENSAPSNVGQSGESQAHRVASLITQVIVDRHDPAFANPTKPIGEFYDQKTAEQLVQTRGWTMREDSGRGFRRVVPSPKPVDIVERAEICTLVESGAITVAAGGGGIPVIRTENGTLEGVDAVIDKDFAAAALARLVDADIFVSVTAVPNAFLHFGQPDQIAIERISKTDLQQHLADGAFGVGSMLPKVSAAIEFADEHRYGIITSPENLESALALKSGTIVTA